MGHSPSLTHDLASHTRTFFKDFAVSTEGKCENIKGFELSLVQNLLNFLNYPT